MTPRQKILADVINHMYSKKKRGTSLNVVETISEIYKHLPHPSQKYIENQTFPAEKRSVNEVLYYLSQDIILDYSDFKKNQQNQ